MRLRGERGTISGNRYISTRGRRVLPGLPAEETNLKEKENVYLRDYPLVLLDISKNPKDPRDNIQG
jgi:hypothetical protein